MTSRQGIYNGHYMLILGIFCGITALGMMAWAWEKELSTDEIIWVLGLFSTGVSLVLSGFERRGNFLQNQLQ